MTSNTANPLMVKLLTFVIVIAAWEIAGRFINPLFLSSPSAIFQAFVELVRLENSSRRCCQASPPF